MNNSLLAGRRQSRRPTIYWWARPDLFVIFFVAPLFVICALLPDDLFSSWKHVQNFISADATAVGLAALGSFALGARITSGIGISGRLPSGPEPQRLMARAQYRCVVYFLYGITLGAYVLLLSPAIRNPGLVAALFKGDIGPAEARLSLAQVPGISSFVNLGPLYVTVLLLQYKSTGARLTLFDKAAAALFLVLLTVRVFLWSERLPFVEVLVPTAIVRLAPVRRRRVLMIMLPFLAVVGLSVFFAMTEYFRSWIYYSHTGVSFAQFVMVRLLGYYATAVNNGALIFETFDPVFIPYGTAPWFFKFPLLPPPDLDSLAGLYGHIQMVFRISANPEFNNTSGVFAPINDFGVPVGLFIWLILGTITGALLRGFNSHRLLATLLFPTWMTGVYEILRIFYWGDARYFPMLMVLPIVYWALSRSFKKTQRPEVALRTMKPVRAD